jgi:hypothetical protein
MLQQKNRTSEILLTHAKKYLHTPQHQPLIFCEPLLESLCTISKTLSKWTGQKHPLRVGWMNFFLLF